MPDETGKRLAAFAKANGDGKIQTRAAHISFPGEGEYRAALQALRASGRGDLGEAWQRTNLAISDAEARLDAREQERLGEQEVDLGWGLDPGMEQLRKNAGTLPQQVVEDRLFTYAVEPQAH